MPTPTNYTITYTASKKSQSYLQWMLTPTLELKELRKDKRRSPTLIDLHYKWLYERPNGMPSQS